MIDTPVVTLLGMFESVTNCPLKTTEPLMSKHRDEFAAIFKAIDLARSETAAQQPKDLMGKMHPASKELLTDTMQLIGSRPYAEVYSIMNILSQLVFAEAQRTQEDANV